MNFLPKEEEEEAKVTFLDLCNAQRAFKICLVAFLNSFPVLIILPHASLSSK